MSFGSLGAARGRFSRVCALMGFVGCRAMGELSMVSRQILQVFHAESSRVIRFFGSI